jgi:hypothetical protein
MRVARRGLVVALVAAAIVGVASAGSVACSTSPVGVDACKRIEQVRCESAQACGITLETPVHQGDTPEQNVAACVRFYDDACLHGIAAPAEPASQDVDACINAIVTGSCDVVVKPQSSPACAFLVPPSAVPVDAAVDADATGQ